MRHLLYKNRPIVDSHWVLEQRIEINAHFSQLSHPPLDLLCVLHDAFLQLASVCGDSGLDVVSILLHHGLKLSAVPGHLIPGGGHVFMEPGGHLLHVGGEALGGLLGVRGQLVVNVLLVHGQFTHAVLDQGAVGAKTSQNCFCILIKAFFSQILLQKFSHSKLVTVTHSSSLLIWELIIPSIISSVLVFRSVM